MPTEVFSSGHSDTKEIFNFLADFVTGSTHSDFQCCLAAQKEAVL